jgi:hypothetical protein
MAIIETFSAGESGFSVREKILGNDNRLNAELTKITHYEFSLLAPQSVFNFAHNKNAYITTIKFSSAGNPSYNGVIVNYTETDPNNVSFTLDTPLQAGAKIKIQFNL